MAAAALTREQTRALFDILTHHETYAEIEAFKSPDAAPNYGFPFSRRTVAPAPTPPQQQQQGGRWWKSASAPATPRARSPVPRMDAASEPTSEADDGEDDEQQPSSSPLLQTLLTRFVLPLPGVRALPREFWSVRVQGLLARLGEAALSESYDKGALGTRKTLATGASAVLEMLGRAALGGVGRAEASADGKMQTDRDEDARDKYDCEKAGDLARAWEDVVQGLVYGDLVDGLFDHMAKTEDLEGHSPAVKAAADYALIHLATFAHHIFIGSPEGQYLLKLLENVNSLIPYKLIKQTLRVGNAATMMSGMLRLLLAKLSVTSVTNWFGLTQSADDGMNLLQRIMALVLSWDAGEFRKGADRVEKSKDNDRPPDEALQAIRAHVSDGCGHETVRAVSTRNAQSIVIAILHTTDPSLAASLTDAQHAQCLAYYSALLSVRDREGITAALCRTPPDLFTSMVRDVAAAYDPIIRSVHARVDLKEHLEALQGFVDEFIRASRPTTATGEGGEEQERLAGVEEYVALLRRNRGLVYRWVRVLAGGCPDVWGELRVWAKEAMRKLRTGEDGGEDREPSMADRLNGLFSSLEPATQAEVLEAVDAHAGYLATLNDLSLARLQYLITSTSTSTSPDAISGSNTAAGPGIYLARWQSLLDSTPITPAAPHGPPRHGRDVKHTTTMGKTGAGDGRMWHADAGLENGPAPPDVHVVVRALGGRFGDVVRGGG